MDSRPHIFDLDAVQLRGLIADWGLPPYRADQVLSWIHQHGILDPDAMANVPSTDRQRLREGLRFGTGRPVRHQVAGDGVQKLLLQWGDAPDDVGRDRTECVVIPAESASSRRRTACISSQIGCAVACRFCASGLGGLDGNLTAGQIVEQVWHLGRLDGVDRISHVVFMGMGEPLANFEQVVRAARLLMADWGTHIAGRRITISTVGLPSQIRRLADERLPVTLAISLHAPDDEIRRQLIPWARYVTIDQILDAARHYFEITRREVTLEYILLRDVNDQETHARRLATIARSLRSNVNLIRYNEVRSIPYARPATRQVLLFQSVLRRAGVNCHIRASRGRDIAAACGQLRNEDTRTASPRRTAPAGGQADTTEDHDHAD